MIENKEKLIEILKGLWSGYVRDINDDLTIKFINGINTTYDLHLVARAIFRYDMKISEDIKLLLLPYVFGEEK